MRIDAYNQVSMVYAAAGKTQAKKTAKTSGAEQWHRQTMSGRTELLRLRLSMRPEDMMYLRISWQPSLWRGITRLRFRRGDRISGQSDRYTDRHFGKRE